MNPDKLPIKYHINVWKILPGYPTKGDVLYELHQYLQRRGMDEFSEQTLNGIWYDQSGVANWRGTPYETHVNSMMRDGTFKESRTEDNGKSWYRIDKAEPWM